MERDIFANLSPLDHRYYLSNRELFDQLSEYLSENAVIKYSLKAERALILAHLELRGLYSPEIAKSIDLCLENVSCREVYEEEEKTQHNIRALVNVVKRYLPKDIAPLVHLGATSADILDTATAMRYRDLYRKVLLPLSFQVEELLIKLAEDNSNTSQIGRTHGQHAVPITFGFYLSSFVSRLGQSLNRIDSLVEDLTGKLAGATGSYNALSLITPKPLDLEKKYLEICGLKACEVSTQLVQPEDPLRLVLETNIAFGILANMADDFRHLQRTEILEVKERFGKDQVGSSTMPQKRNPWNCEHIKSLWKAFSPRVVSFYMDQISEHQRDLTNSASSRFLADYLSGFAAALARMKKVLSSLEVDKDKMRSNLTLSKDMALSEATYILLSLGGESEAHEKIRKLTLKCEERGLSLYQSLEEDHEVWTILQSRLKQLFNLSADQFFTDPSYYNGLSKFKTEIITKKYRELINKLKENNQCC